MFCVCVRSFACLFGFELVCLRVCVCARAFVCLLVCLFVCLFVFVLLFGPSFACSCVRLFFCFLRLFARLFDLVACLFDYSIVRMYVCLCLFC